MAKNKMENAAVTKKMTASEKGIVPDNTSEANNNVMNPASIQTSVKIPDTFIDGLVGDSIQGWAKQADTVVIFIEANKIVEISCKEYRADLSTILTNPNASFSYALSKKDIKKEWLELPLLSIKINFFSDDKKLIESATFDVNIEQLKEAVVYKDIDTQLDIEFYKSHYPDLAKLTSEQLKQHWLNNGKEENRYQNKAAFVAKSLEMQFDFDYVFYQHFYPDLLIAGIDNEIDAKFHWYAHGKQEGRIKQLEDWVEKQIHTGLLFNPLDYGFVDVLERNVELSVTLQDYLDLAQGSMSKPIKVGSTKESNARFYRGLGLGLYNQFKSSNDHAKLHNARSAWRISCYFLPSNEIMEIIAGTFFEQSDFRTAQKAYENGYKLNNKISFGALGSLLQCYEKLADITGALTLLTQYNRDNPEQTIVLESIDHFSQKLYEDNLGEIQVLSNLDKRKELIACAERYTDNIYNAYYQYYSTDNTTTLKSNLNTEKVLIVGDYHIPQCIRYRIDQKVEQLESQGKTVKTVDWTELTLHSNEISLHDIVIFYRVPSVPTVIKALAQVNANGKASFFEIDDLLFEESYPAPIESFGGYVDINTHIELRKAPGNFSALAKKCRFGIASTELLRDKLAKLVKSSICLLHRNGLDSLNYFSGNKKIDKPTIDIFYGSGTQAHNSDFIELALPALEKVLSKYSNTRLIIAGYLELPNHFKTMFASQLSMMPPVKSVRAYWNLLEQADINLAILVDDETNGCKSELKWFEAACLNVPSVLSSTANYRDVINDGEDALLASTPSEWTAALSSLVDDAALRHKISDKALQRVKTEYSLETLGKKLVDDIQQVVKPVENETQKIKKKIAIVNVFFPPQSIGGATRVVSDNFDVLQKKYGDDYELVVFTSDERCTTPYKLETYQHQGVTVYRSTILFRENMDWHPKDDNMYDLFKQFLDLEKPDLVHFHCVQRLTASIVEATKDNNVPYIITAHDAWWISDHQFLIDQNDTVYPDGHPDMFAPRVLPNNVSLSDSIERINYYQSLLYGAKELLTVSQSFADIYSKNGYPDIQVNKNGISSTVEWLPKNTDFTDKIVCAHIGGMANHKGYFLLKEAIEKEQPKNIEMLIVDHSKPEGYENKTYWGKVPVTFIGRVSQIGVTSLYQQLDVLFAPSMWPESYGLVTREAAACGCWVVASNLGGIGEDVVDDKTGLIIEPNVLNLSQAIRVIDNTPKKFKAKVEQVNIRMVCEQVLELKGLYK
ncbi:glycosyltransferase [Psychromonas sp. 14N.309.X.WAT.B.A12]|uniref:glycosyltransferase n=1 Tax=Psychromonas sp. 14N.309.X.WAT.B.A12 TaxID=2998322 RepID=UPI0025AEE69A|nr:glycosyltransferase [Psychromonas sp. 14N.309.X.WAT.B.A12]MDN2664393.1 glycosyltransferase [Psychromonas sp. 14N.309.X.WAT.B.A12]